MSSEKKAPKADVDERAPLSDLQKMEAEWVSQELAEFVKLIQQYRILYLTAVFVALGWILGQLLGSPEAVPSRSPTPDKLGILRSRTDIAFVLCFVPLVNVLFALQLLEIDRQMRTLARYRFILGYELAGGEAPPWRWEIWKETQAQPNTWWSTALNVYLAIFLVILSGTAIWFAHPVATAGPTRSLLFILWSSGIAIPALLLLIAGLSGVYAVWRKPLAKTPPENQEWQALFSKPLPALEQAD
jgi:hypothetical protein